LEVAELGGCAASVADVALHDRGDHAVPGVGDLLRLDREAGPGVEEAPHVLPEAFEAKVATGLREFGTHDEHDKGVEHIDVGPKVALTPPLVDAPNCLHVLLRHRLPSIALWRDRVR